MISMKDHHKQFNVILKNGIKIDFEEDKEVRQMAAKILYLINSTAGSHCASFDNEGTTINIETTYCDPVLSLEFSREGVHFIRLVDSTWQGAFFEVMRILYMWEAKKVKSDEEEAKKRQEKEPDLEWI